MGPSGSIGQLVMQVRIRAMRSILDIEASYKGYWISHHANVMSGRGQGTD